MAEIPKTAKTLRIATSALVLAGKSEAAEMVTSVADGFEAIARAAEIERLRGVLGGINQLARDRLALIPADLVHGSVIGQLLFDILGRAVLTGEDT